jgi:flagellar basal-body rod protein FlgC
VDYFQAVAISAAGLDAQKARVEAATLNLANMQTSAPPGAPGYRPVTAVIQTMRAAFTRAFAPEGVELPMPQAAVIPQVGASPRMVYEPGHPHADEAGMVAYPAVDPTHEMMTVMTALRGYEANLAVLQATRTLATRALDIGSNQ